MTSMRLSSSSSSSPASIRSTDETDWMALRSLLINDSNAESLASFSFSKNMYLGNKRENSQEKNQNFISNKFVPSLAGQCGGSCCSSSSGFRKEAFAAQLVCEYNPSPLHAMKSTELLALNSRFDTL